MIRVLLDQGLPRSSAALLRAIGHDAVHVAELGMAAAADEAILAYAATKRYSVITLDADFHTLLAVSGASRPSVVRIRIEQLKGAEAATLIHSLLERIEPELTEGCAVTVTRKSIRIHRLPIRAPLN